MSAVSSLIKWRLCPSIICISIVTEFVPSPCSSTYTLQHEIISKYNVYITTVSVLTTTSLVSLLSAVPDL